MYTAFVRPEVELTEEVKNKIKTAFPGVVLVQLDLDFSTIEKACVAFNCTQVEFWGKEHVFIVRNEQ